MASLILRTLTRIGDTTKNSPLTNAEVDQNFINLDADLDIKAPIDTPTFLNSIGVQIPSAGTARIVPSGGAGVTAVFTMQTTSGTVYSTGGLDVALADGGTGASLTAAAGGIVYSNATTMAITPAGTSGQILRSNGTSPPSWTNYINGATVSNDTTTNANYFPAWVTSNSGNLSELKVSSTKLYFNPSTGTLNSTSFNNLSDIRLKDNIDSIEDATSIIQALRGVTYTWKDNGRRSYGLIAQELEAILPDLVEGDDVKTVNYSGLIAFLIESHKQMASEIKTLKQEIANIRK
jgi:hypothetical protein